MSKKSVAIANRPFFLRWETQARSARATCDADLTHSLIRVQFQSENYGERQSLSSKVGRIQRLLVPGRSRPTI